MKWIISFKSANIRRIPLRVLLINNILLTSPVEKAVEKTVRHILVMPCVINNYCIIAIEKKCKNRNCSYFNVLIDTFFLTNEKK